MSYNNLYRTDNGIETTHEMVRNTPVYISKNSNSKGQLVFLSHGFAGSSSFMKSIAISLANSGNIVVRFDFLGHGRHPLPFTGNITTTGGTTRLFVDQSNEVIDYYLNKFKKKQAILIGHSMASDIVIRTALKRDDIKGTIGISTYSKVIDVDNPKNLLILNGEWETGLRNKSIDFLEKIGIENPKENQLYGFFYKDNARKLIPIKNSDHVRILYSIETQKEINNWISKISGKDLELKPNQIGIWVFVLLASLITLFVFFVEFVPAREGKNFNLKLPNYLLANLVAIIVTPIILKNFVFEFVDIPAHNHIINHLLFYSLILSPIISLEIYKNLIKTFSLLIFINVLFFYLIVFGGIVDSYVSSFFPSNDRWLLLFFGLFGCIPFMIILQILYESSKNGFFYGNWTKFFLTFSILISIFLDFENLFILSYGVLLFLMFSLVFGFLTNILNRKYNNTLSCGMINGVALSWTFAVAIPMYSHNLR